MPINENAREVIIAWFCKQRRLVPTDVPHTVGQIIYATAAPYLLMIELLDSLDDGDPASGLLVKLIDRAYATVSGAIMLVIVGQLREAEILSRSIFEGSTTAAYIAKEKTPKRLAQLFRSYVAQERNQNKKWESDLDSVDPQTQKEHLHRIREKNAALDAYEFIISGFEKFYGMNFPVENNIPKLIDMLTGSGRRIEYRTVYAAMCSQSHQDAEDVLNYFFALSIEEVPEIAEKNEIETDTFSIFMILFGCRSFLECSIEVFNTLKFSTAKSEAKLSLKLIEDELQVVASCLDAQKLPIGWLRG